MTTLDRFTKTAGAELECAFAEPEGTGRARALEFLKRHIE